MELPRPCDGVVEPFLLCEAEEILHLRAHVQHAADLLDGRHLLYIDDRRQVLDHASEPILVWSRVGRYPRGADHQPFDRADRGPTIDRRMADIAERAPRPVCRAQRYVTSNEPPAVSSRDHSASTRARSSGWSRCTRKSGSWSQSSGAYPS